MHDHTDQLREWSEALARSLQPTDIEQVKAPMPGSHQRGNRRWIAVAASVVVIGAGIFAVATLDNDDADPVVPVTDPPQTGPDPSTTVAPEPTTAPSSSSTDVSTTIGIEPPFEIRTFPDPEWPAVQVPTGPPVAPLAITEILSDAPGSAYDISPDGSHLATYGTNRLCVAPIDDPSESTCADGVNPTWAGWSPDSSMVLFYEESLTQGRSGPLGTLTIEGTVTTLVDTDDPTEPFGGVTAAGFVDDDRVVDTRMIVDEPSGNFTYEVHTMAVDGADDALVGTLDIGTGVDVFFPESEQFDGTVVYFSPNGPSMQPGTWRFEPESGAIGLVEPADDGAPWSAVPVDARGGLLITADRDRLASYTSNRDEAQFFTMSTIDGSASTVIADLDPDYMILSAALSPDGTHLAALEYYRGDDDSIADSAASGRVSIASTASLLRGEPDWNTLAGVGPGAPSGVVDGPSAVAWPSIDRVQVNLIDRAFVIDVGEP